ncbi:hypothetical protein HMPREF0970_01551 [Schaalia odontolytica F0309]|uniref:Uncharacterized protein n=1 Tax=Schaalia odontolytica F0309 TaxID=649742 RepID=D4U015_9ACTO|nr:hypothetical protein HMPREF0970_01551 [Schaalia odontolytica F0309]
MDNWRSASRLWINHGDGSRRPGGGAAGCVCRPLVKPGLPLRVWLAWRVKPVSPLRV